MSDFAIVGIVFVVAMAIFGFIAIFLLVVVVSGPGESNQMRKYDQRSELQQAAFVSKFR